MQHSAPLGRLQVQREAALVAVAALVKVAVPRRKEVRPHPASQLAALAGVFDLDHLRAQVGQVGGAEGTGAVLLHGDDAQAC